MITSAEYGYKWNGLSTDDKSEIAQYFPGQGIPNGAKFFEMDTGLLFMWNATGNSWVQQQSSSLTPGEGIIIDGNKIKVDTDVIATRDYVDNSVGVQFQVTDVIVDEG